MSVWDLFVGEISLGKCPSRQSSSGKYPLGEYPWSYLKSMHLPYISFNLSPPLFCSLITKNYGLREKIIFWMYGFFSLWRDIKGGRKLDTIAFLDTHICIINPYWKSSEIIIFLCKYHIVISVTLAGTLICFLVARCNIIRGLRETKKKRLSYRKNYIEVWDTSRSWQHALLLMSFLLLVLSTTSFCLF